MYSRAFPALSIFLPAYNEELIIAKTLGDVLQHAPKISSKYEIIVVNDGSTDKTAAIVKKIAKTHPEIRLINHSTNLGYGAAIKTGLYSARYPWICYMDADGQFQFQEIKKFLPLVKSADLIIGYRLKRSDSFYRRFMAKILRFVDWLLFGIVFKDIDCGFKLFKKKVVDQIEPLITQSAITETEFIIKAKRAGFKIEEVGVRHHGRRLGQQTGGNLSTIIKASLEGVKLWLVLCK
jgi:glycosyltransferase involved in cell wall biosynthesis